MKFTRTCIALAGATIIVVASAMRPQSATAALQLNRQRSPSNQKLIRQINSFRQVNLPRLANFTRKSLLKIRRTIQQPSNWVASHCFPTGSTTRRNGWKRQ